MIALESDVMESSAKTYTAAPASPVRHSRWQKFKLWLKKISTPPRIQAFEFCDQAWIKGSWREAHLDGMNFTFKLFNIHKNLCGPYSQWAQTAGYSRVLDLASGGTGHIDTLLEDGVKAGLPLPHITVSDLYPDLRAYTKLKAHHGERVDFIAQPVDATSTSGQGIPLLSICNGFHHLPPHLAQRVLANAARNADGIFIAEVFERNAVSPFISLFNLPVLMAAPFFSQRCTLKKVLISTIFPIVPLMIVFDGVISALRTYNPEEILSLLPPDAREDWIWVTGESRYLKFFKAPFIYGYRIQNGSH